MYNIVNRIADNSSIKQNIEIESDSIVILVKLKTMVMIVILLRKDK